MKFPLPPEDKTKLSLFALALPIFVENAIRTSLMAVDQLMLYGYSEKAAAAMSAVNQFAFFIQLLYMMVSIGASIIISQSLGAGRPQEAGHAALGSLALISVLALVLSVSVVFAAGPVLDLFGLEGIVRDSAVRFLVIYGAGSLFMALNIAQGSILRAYGHSRDPMIINAIALALTICGNAVSLYGPFGLRVFGITGVAVSTVFSQFAAFWLMVICIRSRREIKIRYRDAFHLPGSVYRGILAIGIPTAGENLSYNVGQIVIMRFIAGLGTEALAAYGLVLTLSRYVYISGVSIGSATQIKVGYFVGAGKADEAEKKVWGYFAAGFCISLALIVALNLFKGPVIALFTDDPRIAGIAAGALLVGLLLEPARNFNTIITPALKGSGDVRFPVLVGILFMWGIGVTGAWLFGIVLGFGLPGIWLGMCCDEWMRGIVNALRWKSGAWKGKALVRGT